MNDFFKDQCEIVRDLLPLYADHGTSPKTTALVALHISKCDDCSKHLLYIKKCKEKQKADIRKEMLPDYHRFIKNLKRRRFLDHALKTVLLTASLSALSLSMLHNKEGSTEK